MSVSIYLKPGEKGGKSICDKINNAITNNSRI